MTLPTLDDLDVSDRTVLVRSDLNVPLSSGTITDDFRIQASLPTIQVLRDRRAKVVVCSHLGRPRGYDESLSMAPVAARLGELGNFPVVATSAVVGPEVKRAIAESGHDAVVVLENTRFEHGEVTNDEVLAAAFAELGEVFVNDAFGTAHRAHASNVGVARRLRSAAGLLLEAEIVAFQELLHDSDHPYVVVLGGAKVSDKLAVMKNLLPKVDMMLVGGGMCFTLLAASGYEVGDSLVEEPMLDEVRDLLQGQDGGKILLPADFVVADSFTEDASNDLAPGTAIPEHTMGLDIGPDATAQFSNVIVAAERVFWNGPMGVFEWEAFRAGTAGVADAVASCNGFTVVGGGDSVAAIRMLGREKDASHVSSGGGAGLQYLEGKVLPGIAALEQWSNNA
ncbi:phosphoglycerate kinase [bacterium BMS3Bbin02]|nr:phosphoglycerate kinase [bacterium BMS3Bbin02]